MKYDAVRIAVEIADIDFGEFDARIEKLSNNGYEIKTSFTSCNGKYLEVLLQRVIDATP